MMGGGGVGGWAVEAGKWSCPSCKVSSDTRRVSSIESYNIVAVGYRM